MNCVELLERIDRGYARLNDLLNGLNAKFLSASGVNGAWSIKDTLAHISAHEERMLAWMTRRLRGEIPLEYQPYAMPDPALDALNAEIYLQNRERSWEDVLTGWQEVHAKTVAFVESTGEELFDGEKYRLLEGEPLWLAVTANTCDHYVEHGQNIEAWLKKRAGNTKEG